jgi:HlyD family secretion protein
MARCVYAAYVTRRNLSDGEPAPGGMVGDGMDRPIERRGFGRRGYWIASAGTLLALALTALIVAPRARTLSVATDQIVTSDVRLAPFQDYAPVRAEAEPLHVQLISDVVGGQVDRLLAADGALVSAGTPLASLSNPPLRLDVLAREAEIEGRVSDVAAARLGLERNRIDRDQQVAEASFSLINAKRQLQIRQQLHDHGIVSDAGLSPFADEARYDRERLASLEAGEAREAAMSRRQLNGLGETESNLLSNLKEVRASLDALLVRAPAAGRLTNFTLQPGQTIKPGDLLGEIDSEGVGKLAADVDEFYLGRVTLGQSAIADIDGSPVPLVVAKVAPQVTSGRFHVEFAFVRPPPSPLRRGQSLDVKVILSDPRPALVVANGAWMASGGGFAFVLDSSGRRADRRVIAVGRRNPDEVEITKGLRAGERIVTSSYAGYDNIDHLILSRGRS